MYQNKKEQQSSAESPHLISLFIVWRQEEACFISAKQTKLTLCSALNSAFLSGDGVVVTGFQLFSIFPIIKMRNLIYDQLIASVKAGNGNMTKPVPGACNVSLLALLHADNSLHSQVLLGLVTFFVPLQREG